MKSKRAYFIFFGLVLAIIVTDKFLWQVTKLDRYIGGLGGVTGPLDDIVDKMIAHSVQEDELKEKLQKATNAKEYAAVARKLHDLYRKNKDDAKALSAMEQTVENHGGIKDKNVIFAYDYLLRTYAKNKDKKKLKSTLQKLRPLAEGPPVDSKLLQKVVNRAKDNGLMPFFVETANRALKIKGVSPQTMLSIILALKKHYTQKGEEGKIQALLPHEKSYRKKVDMTKMFRSELKRAENLLKSKNYAQAYNTIKDARENFAFAKPPQFFGIYNKFIKESNNGKNAQFLYESCIQALDILDNFNPKHNKNEFEGALRGAISVLLSKGKETEAIKLADTAKSFSDSFGRFKTYIECAKWVNNGRKGPAPRPIYKIAYKPDAKIKIDGKLDESVYATVNPLPNPWHYNFEMFPEIYNAGELTPVAKMFYTDEALYVSVVFPEPYMDDILLTRKNKFDSSAWQDDALEFFISMNRTIADYQQFVVSAGNSWVRFINGDKKRLKITDPMKAPIESATEILNKGWLVELKIPMNNLSVPKEGLHGHVVHGNMRRNRFLLGRMKKIIPAKLKGKVERQNVSWAEMVGNNHNRTDFNFYEFE